MRERYISLRSAGSNRNPHKGRRERGGLPDEVQLAIGMKVMVTLNVSTEIDVTNRARGVIVGIKLNQQELQFGLDKPQVKLAHIPTYVLMKFDRTQAKPLPSLEPKVILIVPITRYYSINVPVKQPGGKVQLIKRNIKQFQLPIAPAYAFTDYRAQGQTLASAVINIAEPPTGGSLSQLNIYVALSWCLGLDSVRILWDFDRAILSKPIHINLAREDERLEELNKWTIEWWN
ncbi:hypothetical protein FRC12_008301 [Ceratobasidium sp. 428]|nr:hypothetical protein FRC12_008301 [Ceratobasidium sp. 428]